MTALLGTADGVLRRAPWTTRSSELRTALPRLAACLAAFALAYGAVMGAFRGLNGYDQWLRQMAYSALKVPLLLARYIPHQLAELLCPQHAAGTEARFRRVGAGDHCGTGRARCRTRFARAAYSSLVRDIAGLPLGVAFQRNDVRRRKPRGPAALLRDYYRPLIQRNRRHGTMLACWGFMYVLVAIQLAWLLRPFIGSPERDVQFLRPRRGTTPMSSSAA